MERLLETSVRLATTEDSPNIAEVHVAVWKETYCGLMPDSMLTALSVDQRTATWFDILSKSHKPASTRVYVAPAKVGIAGFSSCGLQRSNQLNDAGYDGEISAIYVLRSFKSLGIGRRLFERAADRLHEMDHSGFSLWVLRDNLHARGFYEHLGGQLIGERQDIRDECTLHEVAYGWRIRLS